jgi:hypothetical protein
LSEPIQLFVRKLIVEMITIHLGEGGVGGEC